MSASFPGSWEPYGSSQQSQALGWRTPATGPAKPATLSDRWKNAQAKLLQSTLPTGPAPIISTPVPPPPPPQKQKKPKSLDLASFHQAEHEHRVVARYESIRAEVREVASSVKQLATAIDTTRDDHDTANKKLHDEIVSLRSALVTVQEQVYGKIGNQITEEQIKNIVQAEVQSLAHDLQASSKSIDKLDVGYTQISEDVNYLASTLFDRLAKHTNEVTNNLINRHVVPLIKRRIRKAFSDYNTNLENFMLQMEDRFRLHTTSCEREQPHYAFQSRFEDTEEERDREEERLFQRGIRDSCARQSYAFGERMNRGQHDQYLDDGGGAWDYQYVRGTARYARPNDFAPPARQGPSEHGASLDRGTKRVASPSLPNGRQTSFDKEENDRSVRGRLRIRPKRVEKTRVGFNNVVIDLTRTDESDCGEDMNLFGELHAEKGDTKKDAPKTCVMDSSQDNFILSEESSERNDSTDWYPSDKEEGEVEEEKQSRSTTRSMSYSDQQRAAGVSYLTRGMKTRRMRRPRRN